MSSNKNYYDNDEKSSNNGPSKITKIFYIIILVFLGGFIIYSAGSMFYDYYLMKEEIKERTRLYMEAGSSIDDGSSVVSDGGSITSSDNSVITVDEDGNIKATGSGTTTITITKESSYDEDGVGAGTSSSSSSSSKSSSSSSSSANSTIQEAYDSLDEGESVEVEITVNQAVNSITLDKTNVNLSVGDTTTLTTTILPSDATNKKVSWSSSNSSVASVSSSGQITAKSSGTATVTVTTVDGKKQASCKVVVTANETVSNKIVLASTSGTLYVGDTYTLSPATTPDTSLAKNITYTSSNSSVATVDSTGKITAKSAGTAVITLNITGASAKYTVTVKNVDVTGISASPSSSSLEVGDTLSISANVNPSNATNKSLSYKSSNTSVATVDSSGKVTAKASGSATITITSNNSKTATVNITVKDKVVSVTGVTATIANSSINVGASTKITASVSPSNATDKTLTYTSSNTSVATVDSSGNVKGVSSGSATITITASSGIKSQLNVTVNPVKVTSITLSSSSISLDVGSSATLSVKSISPSNAANKNVTYTSSNTNVATVTSSGVIVGKSAGSATITVASSDGSGAKSTCVVKVSNVKVTKITLNTSSASIYVGKTTTLSVSSVTPSNATSKSVTWKSSNTNVATVDSSGKVTGVKAGTATITATASDGSGVTATAQITVSKIAVESVSITGSLGLEVSKGVVEKGGSVTYGVTVKPSNASYPTVTWSSSDTSIATVNSSGKVTGKKQGTAKITATADGKSDTFTVYVSKAGEHIHVIDINDTATSSDTSAQIGDAILLESNGKYAMIDTGKSSQISKTRVVQYLNDLGVTKLEWVLLTHFHSDHYGGFNYMYNSGVKITTVYAKQYANNDSNYDSSTYNSSASNDKYKCSSVSSCSTAFRKVRLTAWNDWVTKVKNNSTLTYISKTTTIKLEEFSFKIYNTADAFADFGKSASTDKCKSTGKCNENSNSLIALGTVHGKYLFFSADLENFNSSVSSSDTYTNWIYNKTKSVLNKNSVTSVAIMKANHHGISGNNPNDVIKLLNATYAFVTNTKDHTYCKNRCAYYRLYTNVGKTGSNVFYSGDGTIIFDISTSGSVSMERQLAAQGTNSETCDTQYCNGTKVTK